MRKLVALALAVAVQGAVLTAPLVHAHPDDHATDHHAAGAVHTHWDGHRHTSPSSDVPAFDTEDADRAVYLNALVATAPAVTSAPVVPLSAFVLPRPAERAAHRRVEVVRSHDPPGVGSLPSRAPPTFLS